MNILFKTTIDIVCGIFGCVLCVSWRCCGLIRRLRKLDRSAPAGFFVDSVHALVLKQSVKLLLDVPKAIILVSFIPMVWRWSALSSRHCAVSLKRHLLRQFLLGLADVVVAPMAGLLLLTLVRVPFLAWCGDTLRFVEPVSTRCRDARVRAAIEQRLSVLDDDGFLHDEVLDETRVQSLAGDVSSKRPYWKALRVTFDANNICLNYHQSVSSSALYQTFCFHKSKKKTFIFSNLF